VRLCIPSPEPEPAAPQGTVLVADDKALVLSVCKRTFEGAGFDVVTASDGREALDLFALHADRINLVVLDLDMPHERGDGVLRAIRQTHPKLPAILMTGYRSPELERALEPLAYLGKPFSPHALVAMAREALA
jgi:two-component system cell cycle sensor histidine kinase/response regulator CckA